MGFLERLKKIIGIEFKDLFNNFLKVGGKSTTIKDITIENLNCTINLANKPEIDQKFIVSNNKKVVDINLPKLTVKERQELKKALKEDFAADKIYLMEKESQERVGDIKSKSKKYQDILNFYKGNIADRHFEALEASLYMKSVMKEGGKVHNLKADIVKTYGEDGRNIANLCTAGYFEGFIKDMYEAMASPEKFKEYFKKVVATSPFAVFSSEAKDTDELSGEILYKLDIFKKYGAEYLAIHGIGKSNVAKIKETVGEIEAKQQIARIEINQDGNVIQVKIFLKE